MNNYVIISETNTDLTKEMAKELDIELISMRFNIDEKDYQNEEMPINEFYSLLKEGKHITTSQVNSAEFVEIFEEKLKEGKDILYVAFSSGLSGTYQASTIAKAELEEKYPDRKIFVFDSKCASMGEGLLVYYIANLRKNGVDIDTAYTWLENNHLKLCHWFTVNDLFHLKRGGRVSGAAALVGTVLGIKPVLHVDDEGKLIPVDKVRGRKQSLDALVKQYKETAINFDEQIVFISHANDKEAADYVASEIKTVGCKKLIINFIGPVIGAHSGPGTIALFFMGTKR